MVTVHSIPVRRVSAVVAHLSRPEGWGHSAMVIGAGMGLGCHVSRGACVLEWWLGFAILLLATWILLGVLWRAHEPTVVLRRTAGSVAPLSGLLLAHLTCYVTLPPALILMTDAIAFGASVVLFANWLVPAPTSGRLGVVYRWIGRPEAIGLLMGVWFGYAATTAIWGWLGSVHLHTYTIFDVTIYEQAMWNTLHGRFLAYSTDVRFPGLPMSRCADHFEPIILLFVPLYALRPSPVWFLITQPLVLVSGAWPVAALARKALGRPVAGTVFATLYLAYPGLLVTLAPDFHPEVLAAPLALWGVWLALEGRLVIATGALIAALACKENIAATVFMIGAYLAWRGRFRYGLFICLVAVVWAAAAFLWVIPGASPTGASFYAGILHDPRRDLAATGGHHLHIYAISRVDYVLSLIGPLAGTCLLAPSALAIAAPELALHLLSRSIWMTRITAWYHVTVLVGLMLAAITGTAWLARRIEARGVRRGALLLGLIVASGFYFNATCSVITHVPAVEARPPDAQTWRTLALLRQVPDGAPLLTNDGTLACHLARRPLLILRSSPGRILPGALEEVQRVEYVAMTVAHSTDEAHYLAEKHGLVLLGREGAVWLWRVEPNAKLPESTN